MSDEILSAVINWNGWRHTVTCVESMRSMNGPSFHLVISDNGSTDDSYTQLCAWAREALGAINESRSELPDGHVVTFEAITGDKILRTVHVMRLERNHGYAGAINRCIEWGAMTLAPTHYWLLNNDVWLDAGALDHLLAAVRRTPDIGLCGSVLLEWDEPHTIQAVGGVFHRALAVGSHLKHLPDLGRGGDICFDVDYPVGASLLVTREFIDAVGPMDEEYFLYYEEMDWAERGRSQGFRPAVALHSKVRHREGASTGSTSVVRGKSMLSEYYGVVNRLRITRKFFPWLVPVVWLSLLVVVADRAVHGEWRRAALILRLMFGNASRAVPSSVARKGSP